MCITMPPAPVGRPTVSVPPTPAAPAPLPPTTPGIPSSPPSPPPSIVLDLVNSVVIAPNGVSTSFQKILADNGVLMTVGSGSGGGSYTIRVVAQNLGGTPAEESLQFTALVSSSATFTPGTNPQTLTVPANNYTTINTTVLVNTDGTVPINVSIGTVNVTLPIAIFTLNP